MCLQIMLKRTLAGQVHSNNTDVITAFNIQIQENNDIVADKPNKKATCDGQVWEHIAFILADEVSEYNTKDADFITALGEIEEQGKNARAEADGLKEEISKLSRNTVSTGFVFVYILVIQAD